MGLRQALTEDVPLVSAPGGVWIAEHSFGEFDKLAPALGESYVALAALVPSGPEPQEPLGGAG